MSKATKIVAYLRVSTQGQGRAGNGIAAQRAAIAHFALSNGIEIADEFEEVETGKGVDALSLRPKLRAAIDKSRELARRTREPIAVAVSKLDRLSRDVHFISGLMTEKVPF